MAEEETLEEKRASGIKANKTDPWPYAWIGCSVSNILELCGRYPEYFPIEEGIEVCCKYLKATQSQLCYIDPVVWDRYLRQSVLRRLKILCDSCQQCELAQNRIPKRGCSFGEGLVDSDFILIGEGPGSFEAATEGVFTDVQVLQSSTCATKCEHFESCYINKNNEWNDYRQGNCDYTPVKIDDERMKDRLANRKPGVLKTTGQILGTALREQRMFRQPFVQVLKMKEDLGLVEKGKYNLTPSVYITNAVRCRCTKLDDNGRIKDDKPKVEHVNACNPWLQMTRELVKAKQTIGVGITGLSSLHPEPPRGWAITKACDPSGTETPTMQLADGKVAFVILHPSYISRAFNQSGREVYDRLLAKFGLTLREAKEKVEIEKTAEKVQKK